MALGLAGAYDRAITVFSPQGRLYQVEYALETVRSGTTTIAIACSSGVVLAVEERVFSKLQNSDFSMKLFQVDEHIGATASGLIGDTRVLVDNARIHAQIIRLSYDEPATIEAVVKRIGDIMQMYTQHAGVRPFGAALLIGGVDKTGPRVFYAEPSGLIQEFSAWSIGRGAEKAREFLENNYKRDLSLKDTAVMALKALVTSAEKVDEKWGAKMVTIPADTKRYTVVKDEELQEYLRLARSS